MTSSPNGLVLTVTVDGSSAEVEPGGSLTIGRSKECGLRVLKPEVSRRHVRIDVEVSTASLTDISSTGTWLAGRRVETVDLAPGNYEIHLGSVGDNPVSIRVEQKGTESARSDGRGRGETPADGPSPGPETSAPSVFISYRRQDTGDVSSLVADYLKSTLGSVNVFRDQDDLIAGQAWQDVLDQSLADSDAAVFLVGPEWRGDVDGRARIDDGDDPVRREVRQAVEHPECQPLPVFVDITGPPPALPDDVVPLFDRHAVTATREELSQHESPRYQQLLVGIWEGLRQRIPNGVLVIGDVRAPLDRVVDELRNTSHLSARELSVFVAGARILSVRDLRRWKRRLPDVFVHVEDEEPSSTLRARIEALDEIPTVRNIALVGAGAAAALAATNLLAAGASLTSSGTTITSSATTAAAIPTVVSGAVANVAAIAIGAAAVVGGGAVAVDALWPDPDPGDAAFASVTELEAFTDSDDDAYPLGEPESLTVRLGPGGPLSEDETLSYFRNFEGGEAERRSVEIEFGDNVVQLDDVIVPVSYPAAFKENIVGTFVVDRTGSAGPVAFVEPGTPAQATCIQQGTGDVVGGWEYTGEPGQVSLALEFESDGSSVIDVGMRVLFEGPADVRFTDEPDDTVRDNCTPVESSVSLWVAGLAAEGE